MPYVIASIAARAELSLENPRSYMVYRARNEPDYAPVLRPVAALRER